MSLLSTYQEFVLHKAAPPSPIHESYWDMLHAALGLATEVMELSLSTTRDNTEEELGDTCWYLMLAAHSINIDVNFLPVTVDPRKRMWTLSLQGLTRCTETYLSLIKKEVFYKSSQLANLRVAYNELWEAFLYHCIACNYPLELCIAENTAKLNQRYADKFSTQESDERKDKVE
jgi:NTP pyrophosphatase (non-canonical NTP hydrolase)